MRYPSWWYTLATIPSLQRYGIVLALQSMLVLCWLYGWRAWQNQRIVVQQQQIQQQQQTQVSYEQAIASLSSMQTEKEQLIACFHGTQQAIAIQERIQLLIHDAERYTLTIDTLNVHGVHEHDWYRVQQVQLTLHGQLSSLISFLHRLQAKTRLVDVAQVRLQPASSGEYQLHLLLDLYEIQKESPSTLKKAEGLGG